MESCLRAGSSMKNLWEWEWLHTIVLGGQAASSVAHLHQIHQLPARHPPLVCPFPAKTLDMFGYDGDREHRRPLRSPRKCSSRTPCLPDVPRVNVKKNPFHCHQKHGATDAASRRSQKEQPLHPPLHGPLSSSNAPKCCLLWRCPAAGALPPVQGRLGEQESCLNILGRVIFLTASQASCKCSDLLLTRVHK